MSGYLQFLRSEPRFLAFGFVLTFFSSFGQTFFISLFGEELRGTFDLSHTGYGMTYSIATLCSGLTILFVGAKIDRVDLRSFSLLLCVGMLVACLVLASAAHVAALAVAFFLLRLCGQGLLSHTAMTSMSRYFGKQRGKALSIAGLGFPAGEALLPSLAVLAIASIGWRQAWFGVAGGVALVLIPGVIVLLKGHAKRHAAHLADILRSRELSQAESSASRHWTQREVLRDRRFYLFLPAVVAPGFIVTGLFFHQGHLIATKGWTAQWFAACFVAFACAQILTSLVAGPLVDRWGATRLMPLFLVPMSLSLVVLASFSSSLSAALFLALVGVTAGLGGTVVSAMWAEVYGTSHLGAIRAMATAIMVFGTAASPVLFGVLIDGGVSMGAISWMCCGYTIVAMGLARGALLARN